MLVIKQRIIEDLTGALITLGENSLPDKDKILEADKILTELLNLIYETPSQ